MKITLTFKNAKSSDHYKTYITEKFTKLDKLLDRPANANIVLRAEKITKVIEVSLSSGWLDIHASEENDDMHAAIDLVVDKIKKQIRRTKDKRQSRRNRPSKEVFSIPGTGLVEMSRF